MATSISSELKSQKNLLLALFGFAVILVVGMSLASNGGLIDTSVITPSTGTNTNTTTGTTTTNPKNNKYTVAPAMTLKNGVNYSAIVSTNYGNFTIELYSTKTPLAVNNFVFLSKDNYYSGLTFHKVLPGSLIQGGDPLGNGQGGPGYKFNDEISATTKFAPYVVAMANSGSNTNGSQFFITTKTFSSTAFDGLYTIFGRISAGFDTIDKIEAVATDSNGKPVVPVTIIQVTIREE